MQNRQETKKTRVFLQYPVLKWDRVRDALRSGEESAVALTFRDFVLRKARGREQGLIGCTCHETLSRRESESEKDRDGENEERGAQKLRQLGSVKRRVKKIYERARKGEGEKEFCPILVTFFQRNEIHGNAEHSVRAEAVEEEKEDGGR